MQEKYKEQVQCVYIDPPYNTKASEIIYKNGYKHSSWMCLMDTRLEQAKRLLEFYGIICVAIDDFEFNRLYNLLNNIYSEENHLGTVSIRINPKGRITARKVSAVHEYAIFFGNSNYSNIKKINENIEDKSHNYKQDENGAWYLPINLRKQGVDSDARNSDGSYKERYYPIYYDPDKNIILPIDSKGLKRIWRRGKDVIESMFADNKLWIKKVKDEYQVFFKFTGGLDGKMVSSIWYDAKYSASDYGTKILDNILGEREIFSYPKSPYTVMDSISAMSENLSSLILDFFAGSGTTGHAVINLNREDNGKRKYILVEMGEYFDTVTKPRIEKVIYSKDWKDGKPVSREGSSHIFKYIRLESYEDTLNNVEFSKPLVIDDFLENEYLTKYKISKEAEGSKIYLPAEIFYNPFEFHLKITRKNESREQKIDLIETFNFLTGLQVNNIYTKKYNAEFKTTDTGRLEAKIKLDDNGAYIFKIVEGVTLKGEKVLVIWRNIVGDINNNDDINQNNAVLESVTLKNQIKPADSEYDIIYINCTNSLQNFAKEGIYKVALIEEVMKDKMFNGI